MLTINDFLEKQLLFIDSRAHEGETSIALQNDNIAFKKDGRVVNKMSLHRTLAIFVIGDLTITTKLAQAVRKHGVSLYMLNRNFVPYAEVVSYSEGNYLARMRQYQLSEEENLVFAKHIIVNKIKNQARLLGVVRGEEVKRVIGAARAASDARELLGIEGSYAREFFREYFKEIGWRRRAPRTKEDIPNLLLDIGYTILFNYIEAIVRLYGLDVYKGVYHRLFFARKSLVADLQEPFRCIIDKTLLKAYRLGQVNEDDFQVYKGAYLLPWQRSAKYHRLFSEAIMERKREVYDFILSFYRTLMYPDGNKLCEFNINKAYER